VPTFERSGLRLWYSQSGDGDRAVVLHTGGGGDSDMFVRAGYVDALAADGYRVVRYDHRGHGRSDAPPDRSGHLTAEYAADVVALLDHLGLESAAIIGYSQGMRIAVEVAATRPERVAALVGIGAVGAADDSDDWRLQAAAHVRAHGTREAMRAIAGGESSPPPDWLVDNLSTTDPEVFALLLEAARDDGETLWDRLAGLAPPCLLVVGEREEDEEGVPPGLAVRNAEAAVAAMARGELEPVAGVEHLGVFWRTDLTLPAIRRFLARAHPGASARA
jgi:pimeloyl-ACP methyl ester carboxylesterase